jgi:hypothetical protein
MNVAALSVVLRAISLLGRYFGAVAAISPPLLGCHAWVVGLRLSG